MRKLLLAAVAVVTLALPIRVEALDANELYNHCRYLGPETNVSAEVRINRIWCMGYVAGAWETGLPAWEAYVPDFCTELPPAEKVTYRQMADVVRKYLIDNPNMRHLHAGEVIARAIEELWPCQ